jgi:hypothetical protein
LRVDLRRKKPIEKFSKLFSVFVVVVVPEPNFSHDRAAER